MKQIIFFFCGICFSYCMQAQLKTTPVCPEFSVDVLGGRINSLPITSTNGEIKTKFPCFSSVEEETTAAKCGASVFYKTKDIYFFTARDYVEIGTGFKGKLSVPLMGAARGSLFKLLGHPKIKDVNWDAYQTMYGILILYFNKTGKIYKIQMSTQSAEMIKLCE